MPKRDRVELDPDAATLQIHYRIPLRNVVKVASAAGALVRYKSHRPLAEIPPAIPPLAGRIPSSQAAHQ
jgi:hypothetical protein